MNKLDALIDACTAAEGPFPSPYEATSALYALNPDRIRRVLEAVREDMGNQFRVCHHRRASGRCTNPALGGGACLECPRNSHAATRAALED